MKPILEIQNVSKKFSIGKSHNSSYLSIRESIMKGFRNIPTEDFWALKNISFHVQEGESIGIIGKNGAGKSTLLKILSKITYPTSGKIISRGRVASLLEVGTGFHGELTGKENIFFNGSILGMKHREISKKFDEIVGFSGTEKFLDTPLKHFSTGMQLRLAFAVAAFLEPEILIIDEVLAVGDAEFQKKCLWKMNEVSKSGRTILFVSHNMNAVSNLCNKAIYLKEGLKVNEGPANEIVSQYLAFDFKNESKWEAPQANIHQNKYFTPTLFKLIQENGEDINNPISCSSAIGVHIEGMIDQLDSSFTVGFSITNQDGVLLFWALQKDLDAEKWIQLHIGKNAFTAWIPAHLLNEGDYKIELISSLHHQAWFLQPGVNAPSIHLQIRGGFSASPFWHQARPGALAPLIQFSKY